jgi:hypothetical protein
MLQPEEPSRFYAKPWAQAGITRGLRHIPRFPTSDLYRPIASLILPNGIPTADGLQLLKRTAPTP